MRFQGCDRDRARRRIRGDPGRVRILRPRPPWRAPGRDDTDEPANAHSTTPGGGKTSRTPRIGRQRRCRFGVVPGPGKGSRSAAAARSRSRRGTGPRRMPIAVPRPWPRWRGRQSRPLPVGVGVDHRTGCCPHTRRGTYGFPARTRVPGGTSVGHAPAETASILVAFGQTETMAPPAAFARGAPGRPVTGRIRLRWGTRQPPVAARMAGPWDRKTGRGSRPQLPVRASAGGGQDTEGHRPMVGACPHAWVTALRRVGSDGSGARAPGAAGRGISTTCDIGARAQSCASPPRSYRPSVRGARPRGTHPGGPRTWSPPAPG